MNHRLACQTVDGTLIGSWQRLSAQGRRREISQQCQRRRNGAQRCMADGGRSRDALPEQKDRLYRKELQWIGRSPRVQHTYFIQVLRSIALSRPPPRVVVRIPARCQQYVWIQLA